MITKKPASIGYQQPAVAYTQNAGFGLAPQTDPNQHSVQTQIPGTNFHTLAPLMPQSGETASPARQYAPVGYDAPAQPKLNAAPGMVPQVHGENAAPQMSYGDALNSQRVQGLNTSRATSFLNNAATAEKSGDMTRAVLLRGMAENLGGVGAGYGTNTQNAVDANGRANSTAAAGNAYTGALTGNVNQSTANSALMAPIMARKGTAEAQGMETQNRYAPGLYENQVQAGTLANGYQSLANRAAPGMFAADLAGRQAQTNALAEQAKTIAPAAQADIGLKTAQTSNILHPPAPPQAPIDPQTQLDIDKGRYEFEQRKAADAAAQAKANGPGVWSQIGSGLGAAGGAISSPGMALANAAGGAMRPAAAPQQPGAAKPQGDGVVKSGTHPQYGPVVLKADGFWYTASGQKLGPDKR